MIKRMAMHDGPDPIDVAVGARIRLRRRFLGFSQTQLAKGLGITFQQVQKYERGANRVSASMLVKTAALLACSAASLLGENGGELDVNDIIDYSLLSIAGAMELLKAFARIKSGDARRAIITLTEALMKA